jgi:biopolymer transport protein ExbD
MKVRKAGQSTDKVELQMTPMIDIVFQLLVFFIMTFKIASQEGDFDIKMPLAAQGQGSLDDTQLPLKLVLTADDKTGVLTSIRLNDLTFANFPALHNYIISHVGDGQSREAAELEIEAEYELKYEYIVAALTAVRGRLADDGTIKDLITNIKFSPPGKPPGG